MAVEAEGKKQATLRQLFSKKVFSKKKPNAREDSLRPESMVRAASSPSLNGALPRITRDSFSDFSKLVESRFQQISEERFFNMPSIKAHHHDTSTANPEAIDPIYDLDMSFSGFSAKKDDLSYLPPIDVGQRIRISIPALSPPTKAPSPIAAPDDNKPVTTPIDVKKSTSLDSMLQSFDILPTPETAKSDDETSFRYLQRGKDLSKRQMKTKHCPPPLKLSNSSFKTAKKATGHVVQVAKPAVPVLIEPETTTKTEPRDEAKPTKPEPRDETKPSQSESAEKKNNRVSKPPSEKKKSRTSFPRKSRQSIYAKVRHSKQVARIAPIKPKQRESKTKALVVANPDCSDSETPLPQQQARVPFD
ncbi:hypothetical protein DSO57_1012610 [Entomophthora muscae]|uniref:Uncharacterized protein n=1 Tax=Entomophthora muscae TaxID=34485 RepID=A0ACC2RKL9_9FUNG|nr:hypothetical protein DSO57_1012610 [Entomophthora muscae]